MNRVSIANLALSNLGEAPIQNLTDDNARARISNARIDDVIRGVLRMHDWNSAKLYSIKAIKSSEEKIIKPEKIKICANPAMGSLGIRH